jgi:hypothetical protein
MFLHNIAKYGLFVGTLCFGAVVAIWLLLPAAFLKSGQPRLQPNSSGDLTPIINEVNATFRQAWAEATVSPAERADSLLVARRLSLGLAGTIPSTEEIRALESISEDRRVDWWVEHLLADRRTSDHLAERFARAMVGVENGPFVIYRRRRFTNWLSDQIEHRVSFGQIARDVIEDNGLWTDSPAVNFTTVTTDIAGTEQPDPVRLAARTSRAFLATRIDCLQCHDDFLGTVDLGTESEQRDGLQTDFHKLAAFFTQAKNSLAGIRDDLSAPSYEYQLLDQERASPIQPAVPFHAELLPDEGSLRHRLSQWVTHPENAPFARAIVNRVWATMFGRPLVQPIDDIPLHGPFPKALELLACDFATHDYDLHRLVRIIASLEVFQLESRHGDQITSAHETSWAVYPMERLRPEQMAGSVLQSTSLTTLDSTAHILLRLVGFGQQNEFVVRFGDFGENEFAPRGETVAQRLLMLNGDMIRERIDEGLGSPTKVAMLAPDPEKALEIIYLATMSRRPDLEEQARFGQKLREVWSMDRSVAIKDLYWTLINSAEFCWSH